MASVSNSDIRIHPSVDNGVKQGRADFAGGTLTCKCATDPVKVEIKGQIAHNHACGCSKCWKPSGAVFSVVAVTPRELLQGNHQEREQAWEWCRSQRHHPAPRPSTAYGVHMFGRIEDKNHAFLRAGLRASLIVAGGWLGRRRNSPPSCSGSSNRDTRQSKMGAVRDRLRELGLQPYDCLSPPLMDALAAQCRQSLAGRLAAKTRLNAMIAVRKAISRRTGALSPLEGIANGRSFRPPRSHGGVQGVYRHAGARRPIAR